MTDFEIRLEFMWQYLQLRVRQGDWPGAVDAAREITEMLAREHQIPQ